jgi:glucose-6-phosphate 1-epimerase
MQTTPNSPWLSNPRIIRTESLDGLPIYQLAGSFGMARFSPQGAHLMDFTPAGQQPLLFLSKKTALIPGKAVRGGIPVIFPWFGARREHPESPMHGLVRTRMWEIEELDVPDQGAARVRMTFNSNAETLELWPHAFSLSVSLTLGPRLSVCWETVNTGDLPFEFEQALHPYFRVTDVSTASVRGLQGCEFIDKTDTMAVKTDTAEAVKFMGETDRVYLGTSAMLTLGDPAGASEIIVEKTGSANSVVWNPWVEKAAVLSDLEDDEWKDFVCVEQANAGRNFVRLPAGGIHTLEANYARRPVY